MNKEKKPLFSVTKKDFKVDAIRGSGPGGQHRNKVSTGIRITHMASGAVATATDSRSQKQNKENAFIRLTESKEFKAWLKIEISRVTGQEAEIDAQVAKTFTPKNVKMEIKTPDGKWRQIDDDDPLSVTPEDIALSNTEA